MWNLPEVLAYMAAQVYAHFLKRRWKHPTSTINPTESVVVVGIWATRISSILDGLTETTDTQMHVEETLP